MRTCLSKTAAPYRPTALFQLYPEGSRVAPFVVHGLEAGDDGWFVLGVGDAKPPAIGIEHFDAGLAAVDHFIDDVGNVPLGLQLLPLFLFPLFRGD